jgi:hypothetical protein
MYDQEANFGNGMHQVSITILIPQSHPHAIVLPGNTNVYLQSLYIAVHVPLQ